MKIVVGASAGAASDLYARVVANHLPKQIPGQTGDYRPEYARRRIHDCGELCL